MSVRFIIQNAGWSALNPSEAYYAHKAMNAYRKENPVCEVTGSNKNVQVHHIVPLWADPSLAADPNNFISLSVSSNIHLIFGHDGNFGQRSVANVKENAKKIRAIREKQVILVRSADDIEIKSKKSLILQAFRNWYEFIFKK